MHVLAPAKINLHLRVGKGRDDGFHPLLSWMCTVGLFDTLGFVNVPGGRFQLRCDRADLPSGPENLVCRAAACMEMHVSAPAGMDVLLSKRIPSGAGLGGGSADAARTLLALNHLWQTGLRASQLAKLAESIGSDVPFFLYEPSAICAGRGEKVTPIAPPLPKWAVLILPDISCPTGKVYAEFDRMGVGADQALAKMPDWDDWTRLPATALLARLVNDLEGPAFSLWPDLGHLRRQAEDALRRPVRMSGSGSSLFTLFDTQDEAVQAREYLQLDLQSAVLCVPLAPPLADDLTAMPRI